jgi:hypothetical protein
MNIFFIVSTERSDRQFAIAVRKLIINLALKEIFIVPEYLNKLGYKKQDLEP